MVGKSDSPGAGFPFARPENAAATDRQVGGWQHVVRTQIADPRVAEISRVESGIFAVLQIGLSLDLAGLDSTFTAWFTSGIDPRVVQ